MDHVTRNNLGNPSLVAARTPVVDFRFNPTGMEGVYVRGVNLASPAIMKLGLDGGTIVFIGMTALAVTAAVVDLNNNETPVTNCDVTFALNNNNCNRFAGHGLNGASCCGDQ